MLKLNLFIFMTYWGLFNLLSCQAQVALDDISNAPKVILGDKKFADVFKPLDGTWVGKFYIYVNESGQSRENPQPKNFDKEIFQKPSLKLQKVIEVQQKYISESQYSQRVTINDTYGDEHVVKKVVTGCDIKLFDLEPKNRIFADEFIVLKGLNEILIDNEK